MQKLVGTRPERALRRWRGYSHGVAPSRGRPETRFVVFCQGRTGSTLLTRMLDQHPDIACDGEIFGPQRLGRIRAPELFLRGAVARAMRSATAEPAYGFKVKPYELTFHGIDPAGWLERRHTEGWKLIHLYRSNVVRHALSGLLLEQRGVPHRDAGSDVRESYRVDAARVVAAARGRARQLDDERTLMANIPHVAIGYEDDLVQPDAHQRACDRIFEFLDLATAPVKAPLQRLAPDDLRQQIANFDDVLAELDGTELAPMLR